MKKLWVWVVLLGLLLAGCSRDAAPTAPAVTEESFQSRWVSFDIYAINDLHGKFSDTDAQIGVDELSTFLQQDPSEHAIYLATGDMWQGSTESYLTDGAIITQWMNEMGFAAMTLGGHEFDWGEDILRKNRQMAQFPFLAINIYSRETNQPVDYCQGSVLVDKDGVQIGIIGAIGDCYNAVSGEAVQNVYFKTGQELTQLVQAEAQALRAAGADFIIYALHDGAARTIPDTTPVPVTDQELSAYYDTALSGYVDLVLEADSHYWYILEDSHGVYHLQAGSNNSGIAHARVLINRQDGTASLVTAELLPASRYSHMADHPVVAELLAQYDRLLAAANKTLGVNSRYRSGSDISQLVANLYCAKGLEKWGADYPIVLGGGYLSCRSPGYLPQGEVTYSQLQALLPFDNRIVLCSIRGRDLQEKFLQTTNAAYYIKTTDYGETVRYATQPDAVYYVVTDSYTADYAPNRMTVVATYDESTFARDLLAAYFANGAL